MVEPHPELRRDPVSGYWVVIAPERALRPMTLAHAEPHARDAGPKKKCPFCPGNEQETPVELFALRDESGWKLRVVSNKFPALRPLPVPFTSVGDFHEMFPGMGHHEVVIDYPEHESDPTRLSDTAFRDLLLAYRDRIRHHAKDSRTAYVTVFKNVGAEAGASLAHSHSQILTTPIVPDVPRRELEGASRFYESERRCVFCEIVSRESIDATRVILTTEHHIAIAPFASRFAFETWILSRKHAASHAMITADEAFDLGVCMKSVLSKIDHVLGRPAYNPYLHDAPVRTGELPYYHRHWEIIPRTSRIAGFEQATGCFINDVPPESAAERLREALV